MTSLMVGNKLEEMDAVTDDFGLCFFEKVKRSSFGRRIVAF